MAYQIQIEYRTGDSFSSEDVTSYVEGEWENLDIVTENLERIEAHYKWYEYEHSSNFYKSRLPKVKKPLFAHNEYDFCLYLKLDNGTEYQYSAFWCGYFEALYSAEVVVVKTKLPKRSFR